MGGEALSRCNFLNTMAFPQPACAAERGNAGLGAHACATQHHQSLSLVHNGKLRKTEPGNHLSTIDMFQVAQYLCTRWVKDIHCGFEARQKAEHSSPERWRYRHAVKINENLEIIDDFHRFVRPNFIPNQPILHQIDKHCAGRH